MKKTVNNYRHNLERLILVLDKSQKNQKEVHKTSEVIHIYTNPNKTRELLIWGNSNALQGKLKK